MERISLQSDRKAIIAEHTHRYKLSSILAKGAVLDISCGIGYGSAIICESSEVSSYMGVDISEAEIKYANENFKADKTEFRKGDICSLDFPNASFDTIICLETLEHIPDPKSALRELARILKDDGILIGSIPERSYDEKCERIYGPNPYHLHRFSKEEIYSLLKENFNEIEIKVVGFILGSQVEGPKLNNAEIISKVPEGSYLFCASKSDINLTEVINKISGAFLPALSMLDYDEELTMPLRVSLINQQNLINEKDLLIAKQDQLIQDRDNAIKSMNLLIKGRDDSISSMEKMIDARDQAIKSMEEMLEKRWSIIQEYDAKVKLLEGAE
jgi:SAM-dependent methyltransferase